MPERLKQFLESAPGFLVSLAGAIGALWAGIRARRITRAEAMQKEAEAQSAAANARREAERFEAEAYAQSFGSLKEMVDYFHLVVKNMRAENDDLRARIAGLEARVQDLQTAHRQCEEVTASLRKELAAIQGKAA